MSDRDAASLSQGLAQKGPAPATRAAELTAILLSVIWFAFCVVLWFAPDVEWSGLGILIWLSGVLVPIALVWLAVGLARFAREMRAEADELRASLAELRRIDRTPRGEDLGGVLAPKLDALAAAQAELRGQIASLLEEPVTVQPAVQLPGAPLEEPQPSLSLGTPAEELESPVTVPEFIRALNFPENENDAEGFQMLRKALRDRSTQRLVRSSQDVLTLLSQDGIYMDDLSPDRARPEVWRAFARGERGRMIAGLGGVRDRSSLALASGRMRQDPVFRDATHHFLRSFDQTFMDFERTASDEDIIHLADTRTARAFMLLGRVTGTFD